MGNYNNIFRLLGFFWMSCAAAGLNDKSCSICNLSDAAWQGNNGVRRYNNHVANCTGAIMYPARSAVLDARAVQLSQRHEQREVQEEVPSSSQYQTYDHQLNKRILK